MPDTLDTLRLLFDVQVVKGLSMSKYQDSVGQLATLLNCLQPPIEDLLAQGMQEVRRNSLDEFQEVCDLQETCVLLGTIAQAQSRSQMNLPPLLAPNPTTIEAAARVEAKKTELNQVLALLPKAQGMRDELEAYNKRLQQQLVELNESCTEVVDNLVQICEGATLETDKM